MMRVTAIGGHRLWAPAYDSGLNPLLALESRTVAGLLKSTAPTVLIDVACGTGRWMRYFKKQGSKVFGVDACEEMLREAKKHPPLTGCVVLANAERLPFSDGVADLALCSFAVAYLENFQPVLGEMARICSRGARIVISDMHPLAAAAGWSRSFKVGSSVYEMDHFRYSIDQIRAAAATVGFRFRAQKEMHFGESETAIFERAGKQHLIPNLNTVPAIWAGMWVKP